MSRGARPTWLAAAAGAFMGLTSCAQVEGNSGVKEPPIGGSMGKDFGNAVSHNAAQHIIDPAPTDALAGAPALDGARAAGAYQRYRTGTVIAPEAVETTNFGESR